MATSEEGPATVSEKGVNVTKALTDDRFEHPAVELTVAVDRPTPARVTIVDRVPGGSSTEYVGFHPEYGGEYWDIDGNGLVFERVFEAEETYTTIYGVRGLDPEASVTLAAPSLEVASIDAAPDVQAQAADMLGGARDAVPGADGAGEVQPSTDDPDASPDASDQRGADTADPPREADATHSKDTTAPADEQDDGRAVSTEAAVVERLADELTADPDPAPAQGTETSDLASATNAGESTSEQAASDDHPESVVARLADEIQRDAADPADLEVLREAFGGTDRATDVRIQHLQQEVSDLAAYTGTMEAFLEEYGTGEEFVDSVEAEFDDLRDDLADLTASVVDLESELEAVADRIERADELEEEIATLRSEVAAVQSDVEDLGAFQETFQTLVTELATTEEGTDAA